MLQASKALALVGITSFKELRRANERVVEVACQRKPPFGNGILKATHLLPDLFVKLTNVKESIKKDGINVIFEVEVGLNNNDISTTITRGRTKTTASILIMTSDNVRFSLSDGLCQFLPDKLSSSNG